MVYVERSFSLVMLIIVSVFVFVSFDYDMFSSTIGVGEGFLPRIISISLFLCIVLYVLTSFFQNRITDSNYYKFTFIKSTVIKQLIMGTMIIVSLFLINIIGMLSTLALLILFSLHYMEKLSWSKSIISSAISTLFLYLIFVKWLNISLPDGIFF